MYSLTLEHVQCNFGTDWQCKFGTYVHWGPGTDVQCKLRTAVQCKLGTIVQRRRGLYMQCKCGTCVQCRHGTCVYCVSVRAVLMLRVACAGPGWLGDGSSRTAHSSSSWLCCRPFPCQAPSATSVRVWWALHLCGLFTRWPVRTASVSVWYRQECSSWLSYVGLW